MPEESARPNEFKKFKDDVVNMVSKDPKKTTFYVCKVIVVIFCVVAIALFDAPFSESKIRRNFLHRFTNLRGATVFTSLYGYILINVILVLSQILGEQLPKKMLMLFSGVATVLCCAAGSLLIYETRTHQDDVFSVYGTDALKQLMPSGVFAILAAVVSGLDTVLTYKCA